MIALALSLALAAAPAAASVAATAAPALDLSGLDRKVSPCDDFYRFACGGWIDRTVIPADKPAWGRFHEVAERNLARLRDVLERYAAGTQDPDVPYARQLGDLYAACMDEGAAERNGLAELRAEWKRIDAVRDAKGLAREVGRLQREGVPVLFGLRSEQDFDDASRVIGGLVQGGLSLPDRDYYVEDDARSKAIREDWLAHVARMLQLAGVPAKEASAQARAVLGLETAIARSHWTRVEMRDPARLHNRVDLADLEKAAPRFPWKAYLASLGKPDLAVVNVQAPRFPATLDALLARTPMSTWRAYLRWQVLERMAKDRSLPAAFVDDRFKFRARSFTGARELTPRWQACVNEVDGAMGMALGRAFVARWFAGDAGPATRKLVADVERAFGRNLAGLPWMDDATRAAAYRKLDAISNKVGYPDAWRSYDAVKVERSSLAQSLASASAAETQRDLDKIGRPLDRGEWLMTPPTVNAYYEAPLNEMAFPAGVLQPPFYDPAAPLPYNYGAIGYAVGHELTHGFDDEGRQFDAAGNFRNWWTPEVAKRFESRTACVVDQYAAQVAVDDVKVDGRLTLGENLADLGGVKFAWAAYRDATAGKVLPDVEGFTPDQQFFLGVANVWCAKDRPENLRVRAKVDPHSPEPLRVNGPLSNLPAFREAFHCPDGSRMVAPEGKRCEVW